MKNTTSSEDSSNKSLRKLGGVFDNVQKTLNHFSQETEAGDKSMRIDKTEVQLSRYDGMQGKHQFYPRHKDNYVVDQNHRYNGQELRKFTMIVFLNDRSDIEESKESYPQKDGSLRLFNRDGTPDADVVPQFGRAIIFKSEHVQHQVRPTLGYNNLAITVFFNQIVVKDYVPLPFPDDWSIFVGIASYRDAQLTHTINDIVDKAAHPERLRLVIYNQVNVHEQWDMKHLNEAKKAIDRVVNLPNPPKVLMTVTEHTKAKNAFYARHVNQQFYEGETFFFQIDSHMRFA